MPIYEFYCERCHAVFSFYSRRLNPGGRPLCPSCGRDSLSREVSVFSSPSGARDETGGGSANSADAASDARMEQAMETLAREASGLDEHDPRQAASLLRRLSSMTGMNLGEGMEEAIRRMEAGEDPERIEEEMGDQLEGDDALGAEPLSEEGRSGRARLRSPPRRDPTLYDM